MDTNENYLQPKTRKSKASNVIPNENFGLVGGDVAAKFMTTVLNLPEVRKLLSSEHFSVDGTLIEAWASMKSFRPKDGSGEPPGPGRNGERDFHGEARSNETHASSTDPDAGHCASCSSLRPCLAVVT